MRRFLDEWLRPVRDAIALSRQGRAVMRQNLWLAVIYNAIAVPVAILFFITPLITAAAMSDSSILVTLNALRVGARKRNAAQPNASTQLAPAASP